jgi:hypothetical protein
LHQFFRANRTTRQGNGGRQQPACDQTAYGPGGAPGTDESITFGGAVYVGQHGEQSEETCGRAAAAIRQSILYRPARQTGQPSAS